MNTISVETIGVCLQLIAAYPLTAESQDAIEQMTSLVAARSELIAARTEVLAAQKVAPEDPHVA